MADTIMTVVEGTKNGMVDQAGNAAVLAGNVLSGVGNFQMPNDGKTIILIHAVTGDTWTFTAITDRTGRTETLTAVVAAGDIAHLGPFAPELWNNTDGQIEFSPSAGCNATDLLLAMRISIPS